MTSLLVILIFNNISAEETKSVLSRYGIHSAVKYRQTDHHMDALLAFVDLNDFQLVSVVDELKKLSSKGNVEGRLYKPFDDRQDNARYAGPHFFVMVSLTPNEGSEPSFNAWYKEEHLPMLSRVPSWISSRRFVLLAATHKAPKYLATHRWGDLAAFESEEFKQATNTPWRTEVMSQVIERERFLLKYEGQLDV